ncbi:hypothetical protein C8J57DRAFT_1223445 [Mycena rebaudengoi]|nr:hypothetical protein C8J57DRAFT_1223445 [Mycena rebaudengoi]
MGETRQHKAPVQEVRTQSKREKEGPERSVNTMGEHGRNEAAQGHCAGGPEHRIKTAAQKGNLYPDNCVKECGAQLRIGWPRRQAAGRRGNKLREEVCHATPRDERRKENEESELFQKPVTGKGKKKKSWRDGQKDIPKTSMCTEQERYNAHLPPVMKNEKKAAKKAKARERKADKDEPNQVIYRNKCLQLGRGGRRPPLLCGTIPAPRAKFNKESPKMPVTAQRRNWGDKSSNILGTEVQDKSSKGLPVNQEHNAKEEKKETQIRGRINQVNRIEKLRELWAGENATNRTVPRWNGFGKPVWRRGGSGKDTQVSSSDIGDSSVESESSGEEEDKRACRMQATENASILSKKVPTTYLSARQEGDAAECVASPESQRMRRDAEGGKKGEAKPDGNAMKE